jgi:D-alanyl-D-alanine endopeptidase (penicillin-binding protein 7)
MKRIFSTIIISATLLTFCQPVFAIDAQPQTPPQNISSLAYVAVDLSNGNVLAQKNQNSVLPIASITKLMNAVVVEEHVSPTKTVTLTKPMLKPEGTSPALFAGANLTVNQLLQAALTQSVNDAANALSYTLGTKKFVALMNAKAKLLGMESTTFVDPDGLNSSNVSSPTDLGKLLAYIYKNHPDILNMTKEDNFQLPDKTGTMCLFQNVNNMYNNSDFLGAKAGYIVESKQTLASVAIINGKPVAIVLLYSKTRAADALNIVSWLKQSTPALN